MRRDVRIGLAGGVLPSLTPVCRLLRFRGPDLEFANAHFLYRTVRKVSNRDQRLVGLGYKICVCLGEGMS